MKKISIESRSFEELVEHRIGFGFYEYRVITLLGLIFIADGIEMSALSLILPILRSEWNIDSGMQGLLGSMLFFGLFLGSFFSGVFSDRLGRKLTLEIISFIQFILGIFSATITNVYLFLFVRGSFGFLLGFVVPLVPTLCAELTPYKKRGKITVLVNGLFSVGQLLATIIAYFCLHSLGQGNWRLMLAICSIPPIFVTIGSRIYMKESPRYVILKGDINKGIEILNYILIQNNGEKDQLFSIENDYNDFEIYMNYVNSNHDHVTIKKMLLGLFSEKFKRITFSIWTTWFGINFVLYALVFILPFFLDKWDVLASNTYGMEILIITTLGEALSGVLAYFLVETETFGRKYSLLLAQIISTLACFISYFMSIDYGFIVIFLLTIARFFGKMTMSVAYPLTAEIYPTSLRIIGVGAASCAGRIASCIMPFITIKLFYINMYLPFLAMAFIGFFGICGTLTIPHDTRGIHLDMNKLNKKSWEEKEFEVISPGI